MTENVRIFGEISMDFNFIARNCSSHKSYTNIYEKNITHWHLYFYTHTRIGSHTLCLYYMGTPESKFNEKKTDPVIIAPNSKIAYILKNANVFRVFFTLQLNRSACFIVWKFNRIKYSMKLWYVPAKKWFFLCFSFFLSFFLLLYLWYCSFNLVLLSAIDRCLYTWFLMCCVCSSTFRMLLCCWALETNKWATRNYILLRLLFFLLSLLFDVWKNDNDGSIPYIV